MNEISTDRELITNDNKPPSNALSAEQFKQVLPKQIQGNLTIDVLNDINKILADNTIREHFRDNLLSYTSVLQSGKFKLSSYVDAVRYVSYKLLGNNNQEAYSKTFPGRITHMISEGATEKTISAYVSAYNKNKLVNLIWEQTLIPSYVLNADLYQKALNAQFELMLTARSETVRVNAADSLLHHLRPPDVSKVQIDISTKDDNTISELKQITMDLAKTQKKLIEDGTLNAKQVAHRPLVINKLENVTDVEVVN